MKPRSALVAVLAVAGPAMMVGACTGGSSGNRVAQLGATPAGSGSSAMSPAVSTQGGAIAFAHCMRDNGLPNWPDPDRNGVFDKTQITPEKLGVGDAQLQAAQRTCQHLLPTRSAVQQHQDAAQALQFSQCMRAHGVTNFPDPDGSGRIPDPAGLGIDQGSPRFEAANQACATYRPPYIPSNEQYNSYAARTGGS